MRRKFVLILNSEKLKNGLIEAGFLTSFSKIFFINA